MKKQMPKNKFFFFVYFIFLISYCNTEFKKETKNQKNNYSTYGNKIKYRIKGEKRHKLLLMSNMVPIRILLTKYNRGIIQIRDITFWWKPFLVEMEILLNI